MPKKLTEQAQRYIVESLACFWTPLQIVKALKDDYGITATPQQVQYYDPTKYAAQAGKGLPEKWKKLFETTREEFLRDIKREPISFEAYRLAKLRRYVEMAEAKGNIVLAAQLLEQAAKERGGMYTNHRRLKIDDPRGELAKLFGVAPEELEEPTHDAPLIG